MPEDRKDAGSVPLTDDEIEIISVEAVTEDGPVAVDDSAAAVGPDEAVAGLAPASDLASEVQRLEGEVEQYRDLYLRKLADFDNFRKRLEREREELRRLAAENVMRELVPVLDNLERALLHSAEADPAGFRLGVEMISRQLWETLRRLGMERLDPQGERFQPQYHEAVQRVEDSHLEAGTVVSVHAKGYLYGGRLLRPAMVAVAVDRPAGDAGPEPAAVDGGEAERTP